MIDAKITISLIKNSRWQLIKRLVRRPKSFGDCLLSQHYNVVIILLQRRRRTVPAAVFPVGIRSRMFTARRVRSRGRVLITTTRYNIQIAPSSKTVVRKSKIMTIMIMFRDQRVEKQKFTALYLPRRIVRHNARHTCTYSSEIIFEYAWNQARTSRLLA